MSDLHSAVKLKIDLFMIGFKATPFQPLKFFSQIFTVEMQSLICPS